MVTHDEVTHTRKHEEDERTQIQRSQVAEPQRITRMCRQLQNLGRANGAAKPWTQEMHQLWSAIQRRHQGILSSHVQQMMLSRPRGPSLHFYLEAEISRLNKTAIQQKQSITKAKQQTLKEKLQDGTKGDAEAYRLVRKPMSQPLLFLEVAPGCISARPDLVDSTIRKAWGKVYQGNATDHLQHVQEFLIRYGEYLYIQPKAESVPRFTADMVLEDCVDAPASSAGWDQWEAKDWRLLEYNGAQRLADLLNAVEDGLPWPETMAWGNTSPVKGGGGKHGPHAVPHSSCPPAALPQVGHHEAPALECLGAAMAVARDVCWCQVGRGRRSLDEHRPGR